MKITCTVEVSRRNLPTSIDRDKESFAILALCAKPGEIEKHNDKDVLYISTLSYKEKYKVYNNVQKMVTKYISEGKATISFKVPPNDIFISEADPLQLKGFLKGVGLMITGLGAGKIRLSSPTKVKRPIEKMKIEDPRAVRAGFPSSLKCLHIQYCNLRRIDKGILKLQNLTSLNLEHNNINELPLALADSRLTELSLHHNELASFPSVLVEGNLGQTLEILDLSYNRIEKLSPNFCLMKKIDILNLSNNKLLKLPRNIHLLRCLRAFSAFNNELKVLPSGIRELCLLDVNLSHNPLNTDVALRPLTFRQVPSLKESSASAILQYKLQFSPDLAKTLRDYIIDHCLCLCGRKVFQTDSACILGFDLSIMSRVRPNGTLKVTRFNAPHEVYFCSTKCWKKAVEQ